MTCMLTVVATASMQGNLGTLHRCSNRYLILLRVYASWWFIIVTTQPQPQPNSTSTRVGVDMLDHPTSPPTTHNLNFQGTSRQYWKLIFVMQPYFDPTRWNGRPQYYWKWKTNSIFSKWNNFALYILGSWFFCIQHCFNSKINSCWHCGWHHNKSYCLKLKVPNGIRRLGDGVVAGDDGCLLLSLVAHPKFCSVAL
jgi:hypothetical protein